MIKETRIRLPVIVQDLVQEAKGLYHLKGKKCDLKMIELLFQIPVLKNS